jgi:hypothetical protein
MKGIVFTEFIDFVTDTFGVEVCESMIDGCELTDDGAYTAVGTYDHKELIAMVVRLSETTKTPANELVKVYGSHLFGVLAKKYSPMLEGMNTSFDLLKQIEDVIHVNVRKLYPDAELPRFDFNQPSPDRLELHYRSQRGLADVAEGLMLGCFNHYGETIDVEREDVSDGASTSVIFRLKKQ